MLLTLYLLYLDVPSSYLQQFSACFLALILLSSMWDGEEGGNRATGLRNCLYFSYRNRDSRNVCTVFRDLRCRRDMGSLTRIGSQRKIATGIRILKRKPKILMIILPEIINLKCLCHTNFLKTFLHLVHAIS